MCTLRMRRHEPRRTLEGREEGAVALQEDAYQEDVDAFSDRCRQLDDAVRSRDSVQAACATFERENKGNLKGPRFAPRLGQPLKKIEV